MLLAQRAYDLAKAEARENSKLRRAIYGFMGESRKFHAQFEQDLAARRLPTARELGFKVRRERIGTIF